MHGLKRTLRLLCKESPWNDPGSVVRCASGKTSRLKISDYQRNRNNKKAYDLKAQLWSVSGGRTCILGCGELCCSFPSLTIFAVT